MTMQIFEHALAYADMGWPVFPVDPMSKNPLISGGFLSASEDSKQIEEWFKLEFQDAAIGFAVPETMAILDIDSDENMGLLSKLPETVMSKTPRLHGGVHVFFKNPEGVYLTRRLDLMDKLDLLAMGGYAILPPSLHPSGGIYKWIRSPFKRTMALTPDWVIDLYYRTNRFAPDSGHIESSVRVNPAEVLNGVSKGKRNDTLYKYACSQRARGASIEECINNLRVAASNCDPPYDEVDMEDMAHRVYKRYKEGRSRYAGGKMKIWRATDFMRADIDDPTWFIERILPQGVTLFVGDPKSGKSIQAENMAVAIANGHKVWGKLSTKKSNVLYMDIELDETIARRRWSGVMNGEPTPDNLFFMFAHDGDDPNQAIKRIDQGFVEEVKQFIDAHQIDVVFIDVLGKIWPSRDLVDGTAYNKDYAVIDALRPLCKERDVAVVLVHHRPKTRYGDITRDISGSMGLGAAADTIWSLTLSEDGKSCMFELTGKMIENKDPIPLLPKDGNILNWIVADGGYSKHESESSVDLMAALGSIDKLWEDNGRT